MRATAPQPELGNRAPVGTAMAARAGSATAAQPVCSASFSSASARRSASSNDSGAMPNGSAPEESVTTVAVVRPSTSGRATFTSTGVTKPSQSADSHGVMKGTGSFRRGLFPSPTPSDPASPSKRGHRGRRSAPPGPGLGNLGGAEQILDRRIDADRLRVYAQPAGTDHHRQPPDQVAQGPVGLAAGADYHRRAEVGEWRSLGGEDARGLVAATQVLSTCSRRRARRGR